VDRSSRPRPPAPPRPRQTAGTAAAAETPSTLDGAAELAGTAALAAAAAAAARAGDKLAPTPLFGVLKPNEIEKLASVMRLVRRNAGQNVVAVGEEATSLFWLARGAVAVTRDGESLGELRAGAFFGEIGLVAGTTRTATVTCAEDCWLLEIPAADIEALAGKAPHLARVLAEYARARLLANVMRTSELFRRLDEAERKSLLGRFEAKLYKAGRTIVAQGDDNERLHVVVSGQCEVRAAGDKLATLGVGDGFGETSLLSRKPAAADVIAVGNTVTLSLSRASFDDVAVKYPELLAEVYKLLVEREQTNAALCHDATDLIL
jgi:CRP-like cAMP-binding protein